MLSDEWRPCCGACRSERLEVITQRGAHTDASDVSGHWRCLDCGSDWDGSELSAVEAADRPRPGTLPG